MTKTCIDLTEIQLEPLMGKTKETKFLDLVIPLREGTVFTNGQVIKALDSTASQINPLLKTLVKNGILLQKGELQYTVNTNSKRVWALKNLLVSIYCDYSHDHSMKRLGRDNNDTL